MACYETPPEGEGHVGDLRGNDTECQRWSSRCR
jgi:hypothetical protein